MRQTIAHPPLTICVLTYGPFCALIQRCVESIRAFTDRALYRLVVGANAVGARTDAYLGKLQESGGIDRIHRSRHNLDKNPMMRRMFRDVKTPFIAWFDDDSYVTETGALERLLTKALQSPARTVMWGSLAVCDHPSTFTKMEEMDQFVRTATWYGGLTPPGSAPGGKGEFNFQGRGTGNPRWEFLLGGFWVIRTATIRSLGWPDRRLTHLGEDVFLGEAIRQQGWTIADVPSAGIAINQARSRRRRLAREVLSVPRATDLSV